MYVQRSEREMGNEMQFSDTNPTQQSTFYTRILPAAIGILL